MRTLKIAVEQKSLREVADAIMVYAAVEALVSLPRSTLGSSAPTPARVSEWVLETRRRLAEDPYA